MTSNHSARTPPWLPAWRPSWGWTRRRPWPALAAADLFGQAEAVKAAGRAFGGLLDPTHPQETTP